MASLALASLTETYTDSEGEESVTKENLSKDFSDVVIKEPEAPKSKMTTTLVSYHTQDDTIASDDEAHHESTSSANTSSVTATSSVSNTSVTITQFTDVDMPPEPTVPCSNELTDKIVEMTRKMQEKSYDLNLMIQQRKSFRNPSIYEKLIDFCNINEFGTNYEPQIYDPLKWDKTSYYDELAKLQKADMEQREKERRERTKIEFLTGTAKKVTNGSAPTEEDTKKRKSKWDQVVYPQPGTRVQPSVTTLTSTATGTKGIVISAFGSLPKKAKS